MISKLKPLNNQAHSKCPSKVQINITVYYLQSSPKQTSSSYLLLQIYTLLLLSPPSAMTLSTEKTQQFPLRVFVVGHDTAILNFIRNKCAQRNYEVFTCSTDSLARNLLKEANECFDIILIDAQMPDLNSNDFLEYVKQQLQIKIPIILMSDDESQMEEDFQYEADDIWDKPLDENCTKKMFRAVRKKKGENGRKQVQKKKRGRDSIKNAPIVTNGTCVVEKDNNDNYQRKKKSVWKWTEELRERFLEVVDQLGGLHNAKPMKIMELMNVPGLTREHVSSYLQKLKIKVSKEEGHECVDSMSKESNANQDNITSKFLHLSAVGTQLGLAHSTPEHSLNVPLDSVNQCDNNPKDHNHQFASAASTDQDNNDNQDTINTARLSEKLTINFIPEHPHLSHEVVHQLQEQNHDVTLDSANQCNNNSLATEQNHQLDLTLTPSSSEATRDDCQDANTAKVSDNPIGLWKLSSSAAEPRLSQKNNIILKTITQLPRRCWQTKTIQYTMVPRRPLMCLPLKNYFSRINGINFEELFI